MALCYTFIYINTLQCCQRSLISKLITKFYHIMSFEFSIQNSFNALTYKTAGFLLTPIKKSRMLSNCLEKYIGEAMQRRDLNHLETYFDKIIFTIKTFC